MVNSKKDTSDWFKDWAKDYDSTLGKVDRHINY